MASLDERNLSYKKAWERRYADQNKKADNLEQKNLERLKRAGYSDKDAETIARHEKLRSNAEGKFGENRTEFDIDLSRQEIKHGRDRTLQANRERNEKRREEQRRIEAADRRNLNIGEEALKRQQEATKESSERTQGLLKDTRSFLDGVRAREAERKAAREAKGQFGNELSTDDKLGILGWEARQAGFGKVTDESMRGRFDAAKKQMQIDYEKGVREGRIDPHVQFNPTDDDVINHMRTNLQGSAKRRERSIAAGEQARAQSAAEKRAMIKDYGGAIAARSFGGAGGSYNGGFSGGMSQAQMEAKARWDAKRDIASGTRGNLSAFPQQKAYRASPQYGQDVYGMAQQNGRTLTPGSVGHTYEQNFNHNQRMMEADARAAQANATTAEGVAKVVDTVPVNGNPTPSQTKAIAQTPMTTGTNPDKNPLGV